MAAPANDKVNSLKAYAEKVKHLLNSDVPEKHAHRAEAYKQMLEIDLRKTLAKIAKLA
jgi:uncharacterized protein with von Willebrand factor type A (vWA) domain